MSLSALLAGMRTESMLTAQFTELVGALNDQVLEARLDTMLQQTFKTRLASVHGLEISVGCVFGLTDSQGVKRALKLFSPRFDRKRLEVVREIQRFFRQEAYPAPEPLSGVLEWGAGLAWFDAWTEGELADGHDPQIRRVLATELARFSALSRQLPRQQALMSALPALIAPGRKVWPEGANLKFRISRSDGRGAGWLTKRARAARRLLLASRCEPMIGFSDWGVKNSRFKGGRLEVLYDWDSVLKMSEPEMVGQAAAQFTACWDFPSRVTPTRDEALAFIASYESARGQSFNAVEWSVLAAAAEQQVTYIARLEHKLNQGQLHETLTPYKHLAAETGEAFFLPLVRPL